MGYKHRIMPAVNPNITMYKPVEGAVKQFGPNDTRTLGRTSTGTNRWQNTNKNNSQQNSVGGATANKGNADQLKLQTAGQNELNLPEPKKRIIDKYIEDNPFLSCIKLEDIDELWYEEMLKIKNDKKWYENEIIKLGIKLELASDKENKKSLSANIDRFRKVVDSNDREDILNLQRLTYEYYRVYNDIDAIKQNDPAFDYKSFMTGGKTLNDLEQLLESEPEDAGII